VFFAKSLKLTMPYARFCSQFRVSPILSQEEPAEEEEEEWGEEEELEEEEW
jgi:hypothetical protein